MKRNWLIRHYQAALVFASRTRNRPLSDYVRQELKRWSAAPSSGSRSIA